MVLKGFLLEFIESLVPAKYVELCERRSRHALAFVVKLLVSSLLLMSLGALPLLIGLPVILESHLSAFTNLTLSGDVEMSAPVRIPEENTQIVIDTTGATKEMTSEKLLITADAFYFKPFFFTMEKVPINQVGDIKATKGFWKSLIILVTLIAFPGVLLVMFGMLFVKYVFLAVVFATLVFVLFDLTTYKLEFRKMFRIACYALTPMVLLEVIATPWGSGFLVPLPGLRLFGLDFYLVSFVLYLGLFVAAVVMVQVKGAKRFDAGRKSYVSQ